MDIIKWRDSYETGIASMDDQHKKLIELINRLYREIRNPESKDAISDVLDEMDQYAEMHLQEEEALLENNEYPDLVSHVEFHRSYRDKVETLIAESKGGNEKVINETYTFLRKWWMEHIVTHDKEYGEFLQSKGVK